MKSQLYISLAWSQFKVVSWENLLIPCIECIDSNGYTKNDNNFQYFRHKIIPKYNVGKFEF